MPFIVEKTKELMKDQLTNFNGKLSETFNQNGKKKIVAENREKWNTTLDKREDLFYKYHRSTRILDLYTECLGQDELYIPRKFRQDNTHIYNAEESPVIRKLELQRFQAECEIFRIRRDNFESDLQRLDQNMKDNIRNTTSNINLQSYLQNSCDSFCEKDIEYITIKWDKKIQSLHSKILKSY